SCSEPQPNFLSEKKTAAPTPSQPVAVLFIADAARTKVLRRDDRLKNGYSAVRPQTQCRPLSFVFLCLDGQVLGEMFVFVFQFGQQSLVRKVHRARVFPVLMHDRVQTVHDLRVVHLDGKLAAAVEASRRQIDGTDDGPDSVAEEQLGMKLEPLEPMHLDADIIQDPQASDTFDEFLLLQLVRWARQHVHFHAAMVRPDQALDDYRVLVALVLHPKRVFGFVDKLTNTLTTVADAPDQMRVLAGIEGSPVPVGLKALDDLSDLVPVLGDDRIVPRLREVLGCPIERHDKGRL